MLFCIFTSQSNFEIMQPLLVRVALSFILYFYLRSISHAPALDLMHTHKHTAIVSRLRSLSVSLMLFDPGDLSMRERKFIVTFFQWHAYNSICLQMFAQLNLFVSQFEYCRILRFILIVSAWTHCLLFLLSLFFSFSFFSFILTCVCVHFFHSVFLSTLQFWCFVFICVLRSLTYSIYHNLFSDFLLVFIKIWWDIRNTVESICCSSKWLVFSSHWRTLHDTNK